MICCAIAAGIQNLIILLAFDPFSVTIAEGEIGTGFSVVVSLVRKVLDMVSVVPSVIIIGVVQEEYPRWPGFGARRHPREFWIHGDEESVDAFLGFLSKNAGSDNFIEHSENLIT